MLRTPTAAADAMGLSGSPRGTDYRRGTLSSPDFAELVDVRARDDAGMSESDGCRPIRPAELMRGTHTKRSR